MATDQPQSRSLMPDHAVLPCGFSKELSNGDRELLSGARTKKAAEELGLKFHHPAMELDTKIP